MIKKLISSSILVSCVAVAGCVTPAPQPTESPVVEQTEMPKYVCAVRNCIATVNISSSLKEIAERIEWYSPYPNSLCAAEKLTLIVPSYNNEESLRSLEYMGCKWHVQSATTALYDVQPVPAEVSGSKE